MTDFVHPESGELLATEEEWRAALRAAEEKLSEHFRLVWTLRDGVAERTDPAELPPRIARTPTQEKVARCPRCGGRLDE